VAFGKERTPAECRARAAWERAQAAILSKSAGPLSALVAAGHLEAARDYEWLARKRAKDPVGRQKSR